MPDTSAAPSTVSIDRLTLHLSGLSESDGRRIAELIGEGLGAATIRFNTTAVRGIQTSLTATPGSNIRGLADQAVADVIRQLQRSA